MKLSDQVCTLQQAKRLKELGIFQESLYYHTRSEKWGILPRKSIDFTGAPISAFTVAELGVMLPEKIKIGRFEEHFLRYHRTDQPFGEDRPLWFSEPMINGLYGNPKHTTEAIMKADLLIHLLETGLLTAEEANKRLQA